MSRIDIPLLRSGAILIVVGLATGFVVPSLPLPRLALSAHLTGMSNGMMLMVLALAWPHLGFSRWWSAAARLLSQVSMVGVWFALAFAAAVGAGRAAPLLGGDRSAGPLLDGIASGLIVITSLIAFAAALIVAVGVLRIRGATHAHPQEAAHAQS